MLVTVRFKFHYHMDYRLIGQRWRSNVQQQEQQNSPSHKETTILINLLDWLLLKIAYYLGSISLL